MMKKKQIFTLTPHDFSSHLISSHHITSPVLKLDIPTCISCNCGHGDTIPNEIQWPRLVRGVGSAHNRSTCLISLKRGQPTQRTRCRWICQWWCKHVNICVYLCQLFELLSSIACPESPMCEPPHRRGGVGRPLIGGPGGGYWPPIQKEKGKKKSWCRKFA